MKKIFKKILLAMIMVTSLFTLASCKSKSEVTFDTGTGEVKTVAVTKGEAVNVLDIPENPTRSDWSFVGWFTKKGTIARDDFFDFKTPIKSKVTLHAGWTKDVVVRFNTKTLETIYPTIVQGSGNVVAPSTNPTKDGFAFKGWYNTKVGKTWNDQTAAEFPLTSVNQSKDYFAYYEPYTSKTHNWSAQETYKTSFIELTDDPKLTPLNYTSSNENTILTYMSTALYGTDVDWDTAIKDGLASYPGDFSKLNGSNIGAMLREDILVGAAKFPKALTGTFAGEDGADASTGKFSPSSSRLISSDTYEISIREDLYWENGDNITAEDFVYSYLQYIDPIQQNFRASGMYPTASRNSGMRIVNARNYYLQGTAIGLGESESNSLEGDYMPYRLTRYLGPNNAAGESYTNTWPFSAPASTIFISQEKFDELGLAIGNNQVHPLGLGVGAGSIANYDIRCNIIANPYYVGNKDANWPTVNKEDVGIEATGKYTLKLTFEVPVMHSSVMSQVNFKLVHKPTYEASLNSNKQSSYGTSITPPLSYGAYTIKTWDSKQKIVLNKNYNSFNHVNYNYKSISFEFYSNNDQRMKAFDDGLLDVAGLNQVYYPKYLENPSLKNYINGYPQYLMFNTVAYEGQNSAVAEVIKEKEFRQAFFFGFNRIEFANTVYAPNIPSLMLWPVNGTQYDNDAEWYSNTPEYAQMLIDLGIDKATYGYDPVKAKALFDEAYAKWIEAGNTGPITLNYLTRTGNEYERMDNYIISHFTNLFGTDKIKFNKNVYTTDVGDNKQDSHEFDITLTAVGYGIVTNTSVMLPIVGLFMAESSSGYGFNTMEELGISRDVLIVDEANKLDLRATYQFLKERLNLGEWDEETDEGTLKPLYDILDANNGYFVGDLTILHEYGKACLYIWAGLAPQYDGDVEDRNTVTRAFDRIILEYAPLIPTTSRASAVVYSSAVTCVWPAYHNIMEWGQLRYWYLNTDPDFPNK